jgi:hypothetical protein
MISAVNEAALLVVVAFGVNLSSLLRGSPSIALPQKLPSWKESARHQGFAALSTYHGLVGLVSLVSSCLKLVTTPLSRVLVELDVQTKKFGQQPCLK